MARKPQLKFTTDIKSEIWSRYRRGESLNAIGRVFGTHSSSIYVQVSPSGGIQPPERKRSRLALTLSEREEISRGLVANLSVRTMASQLGRSPSTVSREIRRNGGCDTYRATQADQNAWSRLRRPKKCKLAINPELAQVVEMKLRLDWSPEQIAGWLKRQSLGDEQNQVSHETIYRSLFVQARGVLKKELQLLLRSKRTIRRSKQSSLKRGGLGGIPGAISIRDRPASVEDRAIPGHWEGDLIEGSSGSCIATLVERHSRYVMLAKLENKKTDTVMSALINQAKRLPNELYKSLTWDRGIEMKGHQRFTLETDIQIYFCDPYSPWQRGSNENTNRLLRQYLQKWSNLSNHSQQELDEVARKLNERPRKTLGYETPADRFERCVATTH